MFVSEFTLSFLEVALILDALQVPSLIGMPADAFHISADTRRRKLSEAVVSLSKKGLASQDAAGTVKLDRDLVAIVKVAADADLCCVIVKNVARSGSQLFVQSAYNNAVVEHTRPTEDTHRFAVLRSQEELPVRWAQILPLSDNELKGGLKCSLKTFDESVKLVNQGNQGEARRLLSSRGSAEVADKLVDDMAYPSYSANIAVLWREDRKIVRARNPMLLAGSEGGWLIRQDEAVKSDVTIERTTQRSALMHLVKQWKAVASGASI